MRDFRRRIYRGLGEVVTDMRAIVSQRSVLRTTDLDPAFRERLMLVVTGVNGCRYCSYAHVRQAVAEGISPEEIEMLHGHTFGDSPTGEVPALLYAQHWAEANGKPDPAARAAMADRYGDDTLASIEIILRMIRTANLLGNTFDYILHHLSLGRFGGGREGSER